MGLLQDIQRWQQDDSKPFSIHLRDPGQVSLSKKLAADGSRCYLHSDPKIFFTKRELQIALLMLDNKLSYKELADELKISPRTVEFYIQSLRNKFHMPNKMLLLQKLCELREKGEF